jgi:RNA polymerase sigma factor (sigma-70 family)
MSFPASTTTGETGEDRDLMRRAQAGDEAAFGALMHRWERPVKALLARLVFNTRDADELAQETFVRVWQHRAKFRPEAEFRPWLFSIAVNLARNRLRWWRSRPEVSLAEWDGGPARGEDGSVAAERNERAQAVQAAIARLPAEQREALVMFAYEQMSQADIATTVGATTKAVENRIARARVHLRSALAGWL